MRKTMLFVCNVRVRMGLCMHGSLVCVYVCVCVCVGVCVFVFVCVVGGAWGVFFSCAVGVCVVLCGVVVFLHVCGWAPPIILPATNSVSWPGSCCHCCRSYSYTC